MGYLGWAGWIRYPCFLQRTILGSNSDKTALEGGERILGINRDNFHPTETSTGNFSHSVPDRGRVEIYPRDKTHISRFSDLRGNFFKVKNSNVQINKFPEYLNVGSIPTLCQMTNLRNSMAALRAPISKLRKVKRSWEEIRGLRECWTIDCEGIKRLKSRLMKPRWRLPKVKIEGYILSFQSV